MPIFWNLSVYVLVIDTFEKNHKSHLFPLPLLNFHIMKLRIKEVIILRRNQKLLWIWVKKQN